MVVSNLHCKIDIFSRAPRDDPIYPIDFELVANQVVRIADNHAVGLRIEIDHVARPHRAAGQALALTDGKKLDPFVLTYEIPIHIVNFAATKLVLSQVRTLK